MRNIIALQPLSQTPFTLPGPPHPGTNSAARASAGGGLPQCTRTHTHTRPLQSVREGSALFFRTLEPALQRLDERGREIASQPAGSCADVDALLEAPRAQPSPVACGPANAEARGQAR